jgi:hypothetical protein
MAHLYMKALQDGAGTWSNTLLYKNVGLNPEIGSFLEGA